MNNELDYNKILESIKGDFSFQYKNKNINFKENHYIKDDKEYLFEYEYKSAFLKDGDINLFSNINPNPLTPVDSNLYCECCYKKENEVEPVLNGGNTKIFTIKVFKYLKPKLNINKDELDYNKILEKIEENK